jgi:hypothetical protein
VGAEDREAGAAGRDVFPEVHREASAFAERDYDAAEEPGCAAWIRSNSARS